MNKSRLSGAICAAVLSFAMAPAGAALVSQDITDVGTTVTGGVTLDTDTNLEWLDLSVTTDQNFNFINGGSFTPTGWNVSTVGAGFRYATKLEVGLFFAHGLEGAILSDDTTPYDHTSPITGTLSFSGATATDNVFNNFLTLIDITVENRTTDVRARGMYDDLSPSTLGLGQVILMSTTSFNIAGLTDNQFSHANQQSITGSFLVRTTTAPPNEAPTADAGADQSIRAGDTVSLDGSVSFDDNTMDLDYAWSFFSLPGGSTATLIGANTATPSFVADLVGTYVVELVVTDEGALLSLADQVEISTNNLAPTAAAGDDELVIVFTPVTLDGSASSDPENDSITYAWSLISQPIGSTTVLIDDTTATPMLTPDLPGTYEVTLVVSDFIGEGEIDQVDVVATTAAGYAEILIMDADGIVAALAEGQFTKKGNQKNFRKLLGKAIRHIDKANAETDPEKAAKEIDKAIKELNDAIVRTDGCPIWGDSPDDKDNAKDRGKPEKDWITDCLVQNDVYVLLYNAVDALTP